MAAARPNLTKLILPNTREGGAWGGTGRVSPGTPGWEFPWFSGTHWVVCSTLGDGVVKSCLLEVWESCPRYVVLSWSGGGRREPCAPSCSLCGVHHKRVSGYSYWPGKTFCLGLNTNSWLDTRTCRHVPKGKI